MDLCPCCLPIKSEWNGPNHSQYFLQKFPSSQNQIEPGFFHSFHNLHVLKYCLSCPCHKSYLLFLCLPSHSSCCQSCLHQEIHHCWAYHQRGDLQQPPNFQRWVNRS